MNKPRPSVSIEERLEYFYDKLNQLDDEDKNNEIKDSIEENDIEKPTVNGIINGPEDEKQENSKIDSLNNKNEKGTKTEDDDDDEAFKIQEWCVYGEKNLDAPDLVLPKGM